MILSIVRISVDNVVILSATKLIENRCLRIIEIHFRSFPNNAFRASKP